MVEEVRLRKKERKKERKIITALAASPLTHRTPSPKVQYGGKYPKHGHLMSQQLKQHMSLLTL